MQNGVKNAFQRYAENERRHTVLGLPDTVQHTPKSPHSIYDQQEEEGSAVFEGFDSSKHLYFCQLNRMRDKRAENDTQKLRGKEYIRTRFRNLSESFYTPTSQSRKALAQNLRGVS